MLFEIKKRILRGLCVVRSLGGGVSSWGISFVSWQGGVCFRFAFWFSICQGVCTYVYVIVFRIVYIVWEVVRMWGNCYGLFVYKVKGNLLGKMWRILFMSIYISQAICWGSGTAYCVILIQYVKGNLLGKLWGLFAYLCIQG